MLSFKPTYSLASFTLIKRLFSSFSLSSNRTSLVAHMVKHLLTMWEIQVQSLGQEDLLEKEMATHYSTLAWKIPWMEEPGRLQFMGSRIVRHNRATSLSLFTFMHWRRKWQPTPVFLPGESQGRGSLVGCGVAQSWTRLSSSSGARFLDFT